MLRYIESKHAINKTIKHIEQSNIDPRVIIVFTDNTYIAFVASRSWDNLELEECSINVSDFNDNQLVALGFMTQEEIDQFRKDRDDKRIRDNMVWERQKLIELKKKYE